MTKPEVKIKDWRMANGRLYGKVQDHPRFDKYTEVVTSPILEQPFLAEDGDKVETMNTIYILVGQEVPA